MSEYCPAATFPPKPGREGMNSVKVTTGSPLLKTRTNRPFKSNGKAPRRTDIRKSR